MSSSQGIGRWFAVVAVMAVAGVLLWYFRSTVVYILISAVLAIIGGPLVRLLLECGCTVTGCDKTPREKLDAEVLELERLGCILKTGDDYLENISADLVFRTPGMHPNHPALCALRTQGIKITSEMDVFFALCPCKKIAVTGSDGKTTTTTLIAEMLKAAGKTVWLGGNIGTPLLPLVREMKETDFAVVELSSFQLMDMTRSPHIAVVTNLAPNHLDVHKDMEEYVDAKKNIHECEICCNLTDGEHCTVCSAENRDEGVICVVEDPRALIAIEKMHGYRGLYHVLHGALSPMRHIGPDQIKIKELMARIEEGNVGEVILATNSTVEGEATAMYLARLIAPYGVKISRIANGVPVGGDLEYTDEITLKRALDGRYDMN